MAEHGTVVPGTLYVVATPIGNRDDITLRALKILQAVDRIAAEDTRHTGRLLRHHGVATPLVSYHEHNERQRTGELLAGLGRGEAIALVSDAGTPAISDPGFVLVHEAVRAGFSVSPIPGACALTAALSAAGLPTEAFLFLGFPARKAGRRQRELESLAEERRTLIWYESPRRIARFVAELAGVFGERHAVIGREMTKRYETFMRGPLPELAQRLDEAGDIKGEVTLLLTGRDDRLGDDAEAIKAAIRRGLADGARGHAALARDIATAYGLSRREVYGLILAQRGADEGD